MRIFGKVMGKTRIDGHDIRVATGINSLCRNRKKVAGKNGIPTTARLQVF